MSRIGDEIRAARDNRKWNRERLAEEATELRRKTYPKAKSIEPEAIEYIERTRNTVRLEPDEPIVWVLRVLGLGPDPILRALGLAA